VPLRVLSRPAVHLVLFLGAVSADMDLAHHHLCFLPPHRNAAPACRSRIENPLYEKRTSSTRCWRRGQHGLPPRPAAVVGAVRARAQSGLRLHTSARLEPGVVSACDAHVARHRFDNRRSRSAGVSGARSGPDVAFRSIEQTLTIAAIARDCRAADWPTDKRAAWL
jgi:hypothetical protein